MPFFSRYKNLMPRNVTFKLIHYIAGDLFSFDRLAEGIKGTGEPDADYMQTVQDMAIITMEYSIGLQHGKAPDPISSFRYSQFLTEERLIELKTLRHAGEQIPMLPPVVRPAVPSVIAPARSSEIGVFAAEPRTKKPRYEVASAPLSADDPAESEQISRVEMNLLNS